MDEELIFHLIPRYIIYAMHIGHLIEVQGEKRLNRFIILMDSGENSTIADCSDLKSICMC